MEFLKSILNWVKKQINKLTTLIGFGNFFTVTSEKPADVKIKSILENDVFKANKANFTKEEKEQCAKFKKIHDELVSNKVIEKDSDGNVVFKSRFEQIKECEEIVNCINAKRVLYSINNIIAILCYMFEGGDGLCRHNFNIAQRNVNRYIDSNIDLTEDELKLLPSDMTEYISVFNSVIFSVN